MPSSPKTFRSKERAKEREQFRGSCVDRGYDWQWMKISKAYREAHPVCEICNDTATDDVDHIIPFKGLDDPLRTAWDNLQAACRPCHNRKTRQQ